jgi:hypothetical protein
MRGPLRMTVAGAVILVIVLALILETPGTVASVGLVIVLLAMVLVILQERRRPS